MAKTEHSAHLHGAAVAKKKVPGGRAAVGFLWPTVLGLVFARLSIIVGSYGSYVSTDEGIFTDGATIVSMIPLIIVLFIFLGRDVHLGRRRTTLIMYACIVIQTVVLVALSLVPQIGASTTVRFILNAVNELIGILTLSYWLRRGRGASTTTAVVFLFSALAISEVLLFITALLPALVANIVAAVFALAQLPLIVAARKRPLPVQIDSPNQSDDYQSFVKGTIANKRFLVATALGVGVMSLVIGMLRGYPAGNSIAFTLGTRIAYMLLVIVICVAVVFLVLRKVESVMTVGIWIVMQALACVAIIMYTFFPDSLQVGAVFTTSLNAMMVVFTWYIMLSFMNFGHRDPYYYCIGGFAAFLLPRALARMALGPLSAFVGPNGPAMCALMAGLLMLSTQFMFLMLIRVLRTDSLPAVQGEPARKVPLERLMGIDSDVEGFSGLRQATMQHNAEEMGAQFMLSDREIEVLSLYALGYTQKKVSEELFISPDTVHAHIKRIYSKTGLHSRQDILDYLQDYTS